MGEAELTNLAWIARPDDLLRMVDALAQEAFLGVDTESNSLFAYQEQVCLIQFSTAQMDYLVDPLALKDLSPLGPIFANPQIEKIFHAAEYDVVCLKRDFNFTFANLFDTMLAARILGKAGLGLGTMLLDEFGVDVDKRYQRADWARRPISPAMMNYARMDTHYLIPLRDKLRLQLASARRLELAEEDFYRLTLVHASNHENGGSCWRISGAQDLSPRQAAVLMQLCQFRDEQARAVNQPVFRVMPNQALLEMAQLMPRKWADFNQVSGLSQKLIQRYGAGLLKAVERGIVGPPAYRPYSPRPDDQLLWRLDTLRNWRKSTARVMGVESDIVLPRDIMEMIAERNPRNVEELAQIMAGIPWRLDHFGREILDLLS
jgi:ribonuclease D